MKRSSVFLCAIIFACVFSLGAVHAAQWAKTYGGAGSETGGIIPIAGGGYYVYGSMTSTASGEDTLFGQLNSLGAVTWAKQIGGAKNDSLSVEPLSDGFLVTGTTKSFPTAVAKDNILWAKFDKSWKRVYANVFGDAGKNESGSFYKTSDGGLLFSGSRTTYLTATTYDTDILLIKTRPNGTIMWTKVLDYGFQDSTGVVIEVSDGYMVAGMLQDPIVKTWGILVMKLSKAGSILWKNQYTINISGTFDRIGTGGSIRKLSGGNFLIVGLLQQLNPILGGNRTILAKINSSGGLLWSNSYGSADSNVSAFSVIEDAVDQSLLVSGPIMVADIQNPNYGNTSILVMKVNSSSGAILKQKQIGLGTDVTSGVVIKSGTGLYFTGMHMTELTDTHPKVLYGKLNATTYAPVWAKTFGGTAKEYGASVKTAAGFFLGGTTFSFGYNHPAKGNVFGMILDANGNYPDCYVSPISLLTKNPMVTAIPLALNTSHPAFKTKTAGTASSIVLPAVNVSLPSTNICPPITTASDVAEEAEPETLYEEAEDE